ncbi:MAG: transposase, partial [Planctomycetaceae bacterium]|nr:transposase [Planctomycetaceae bacterium]
MKKFNRKSEVKPVANEKLSGVVPGLLRFIDDAEKGVPLSIAPMPEFGDVITEIAREGAKRLLTEALECEIAARLAKYESVRDEHGHKPIVRNGHCQTRTILTGVGGIEVTQPQARDKREKAEREPFPSKILPPYLRKAKTLEEFIPILYLRGVSTGGMEP